MKKDRAILQASQHNCARVHSVGGTQHTTEETTSLVERPTRGEMSTSSWADFGLSTTVGTMPTVLLAGLPGKCITGEVRPKACRRQQVYSYLTRAFTAVAAVVAALGIVVLLVALRISVKFCERTKKRKTSMRVGHEVEQNSRPAYRVAQTSEV